MWHVWERKYMRTGFCWWNFKESLHLEDPGIDGRIIWNRKNELLGVDWINLVQDRDRLRAVVTMAMDFRII